MMFNLRLILLGVAAAAIAFFVWDYTNTKAENKRLNNELTAANETIGKLDQKVEAEMEITRSKDEIIRRIRNAPDSDDGPIAPVLKQTIESLK